MKKFFASLAVVAALVLGLVLYPAHASVHADSFRLAAAVTTTPSGSTVTLSWVAPATYTTGAAIPAGTAITYTVYGALCGSPKQVVGTSTTTSSVRTNVNPGTQCWQVTATIAGLESAQSNEASAVINPPALVPAAPSGLQATVQLADNNAYKMRQVVGDYSFVAYGTLPVGTVCVSKHNNDGFSIVDRNTVKMFSLFDTQPVIAYAHCS